MLTCCAALLLILASCSDDELVSAIGSKTMPFDTYFTTVRPNDDFYEYCLGPWLEQANASNSYKTTVSSVFNEQINNVAGENITYLLNLYHNRTTAEQKIAASQYIETLENEIGAVTTQGEALQLLARTYQRAFTSFFFQDYYFQDEEGRMKEAIEPVVESIASPDSMRASWRGATQSYFKARRRLMPTLSLV